MSETAPDDIWSAALQSASGLWIWDVATKTLRADARFAALTGLDAAGLASGVPVSFFFHGIVAEDLLRVKIAVAAVMRGAESFAKTYRVGGADGVVRWVSARGRAEIDGAGKITRFRGELTDVTDLKRVEERLRIAQTAGGVGSFEHVDGFGTVHVSDQFCRLLGLHPADSLPVRTINGVVHPQDLPIIWTADTGAAKSGGYQEMRIRRGDTGAERWIARRGEHRSDTVGGPRFIGVIYDITEIKQTNEKLRELTRTLEDRVKERTRERDRIWNRSVDLIAVLGRDGVLRSVNPAWFKLLHHPEETLLGRRLAEFVAPEDQLTLAQALDPGETNAQADLRLRGADGAWLRLSWTIVPEDDALYAIGRDVTERSQLEEQLRQSQKMEAVGQLTGGIAHDFNNMLTGIIAGLELARRRLETGRLDDALRFMEGATSSAERAATLTHRLLAFSRRQTLDLQSVDVGALLHSIKDLLERTLGEGVALEVSASPDLWPARCDANQLESALLNLAINARDAMPNGGSLTLECANLSQSVARASKPDPIQPGDYVVIRVSDTGVGMPDSIKSKAFDPFFTTKPIGKGTGLGLSMVYGFVRQSGGFVSIDSEPGVGTKVKLYLPRIGDAAPGLTASHPVEAAAGSTGESVLLVEDDAQVRLMVRSLLADMGYRVSEAINADAALVILRADEPVHLLITDVGLPGMNGRQLADIARQMRPSLPVLFVTGYAANAPIRSEFLAAGMRMISKPFSLQALSSAVREALEG